MNKNDAIIFPVFSTVHVINLLHVSKTSQGGREHCAVYYTSPQSFTIFFVLFVGLTTLGNLIDFIGCFVKFIIQKFQPLIVINRRGIFVYHNWGCTSIYWPLSHPFRYLENPHYPL